MRQSLGLIGLESIHYYVHDLARTRDLFCKTLDFTEVGSSDETLDANGKQHSVMFQAGQCRVVVSEPRGIGGRAWRYLRKHPEGIGTLVLRVEDIQHTFEVLERRGGTPMSSIRWQPLADGTRFGHFSITTPFGDTTFRFVERESRKMPYPGFKPYPRMRGGTNRFQVSHFDHITGNFPTIQPVVLWLEHVLGFQRYWPPARPTAESKRPLKNTSGLKSVVMWDPESKVKFALNEPARPHFKASQINLFNEAHRGCGVQHIALAVVDIQSTAKGLQERKASIMPTSPDYYDQLPQALQEMGVGDINESIDTLRQLGLLVDGEQQGAYTLKLFLQAESSQYSDAGPGPFLLQLLQRCGDKGFGNQSFRALFHRAKQQPNRNGVSMR